MPDDDFFIRRFARARDAGDVAEARQIWQDACERKFDLVSAFARGHRFPGGGRLSAADVDDAVTEGMLRILQMGANFRGTSAAEFRAAIKRAVWFACMDTGRDVLAYEEHIGGSLDARYEDSDEAGPYDAAVERHLREQADIAGENDADALEEEHSADLVHWAIGQISNDNYRIVLEMTFIQKLPGEEIGRQLGIDINNVYQRRRRGLNTLEEILRDHRR